MELIRKLLLYVEAVPEHRTALKSHEIEIEGFTGEQIDYHLMQMEMDDLIVARQNSDMHAPRKGTWLISYLAPQGHDFLDAARNPTIWSKMQERVAAFGGNVALSVLVELGTALTKEALGLGKPSP